MRRSKLETYVDILRVLAHWGPLKLTHVMYKANVNSYVLTELLGFLVKQGLVEVKAVGHERNVYKVTQGGVAVLKQFREITEVMPVVEEAGNEAIHQRPYPF